MLGFSSIYRHHNIMTAVLADTQHTSYATAGFGSWEVAALVKILTQLRKVTLKQNILVARMKTMGKVLRALETLGTLKRILIKIFKSCWQNFGVCIWLILPKNGLV